MSTSPQTLDLKLSHFKNSFLVGSRAVEKFLMNDPKPDGILIEIVLSYNGCGSYNHRIQVLSIIATKFSFSTLAKLNPDYVHQGRRGRHSEIGVSTENAMEDVECVHEVPDDVTFNPPITKHIFQRARYHYFAFEHGNAPVVRPQSYTWRIRPEVINAIIEYVTGNFHYVIYRVID